MKPTLQAGLRHTAGYELSRERTIDFMGQKPTTGKRLAATAAKAGLA
jgi:hypothetical protein